MGRVYNFSAGPAVLPEEVLREAAEEMLDYKGTGMSVMEMSHRSKAYEEIIQTAEQDLRDLMNIPDNYKVLFLQGGASQQFAMIPMNLMKNKVADYIITGQWAKKAYQEAKMYGKANAIASSADETFSYIPDCSDLPISEDADYVYICENNTIYGTKFKTLPNTKGKLLISDQLEGVAGIMKTLSQEVDCMISVDSGLENKLIDELASHNIICMDAIVYHKDAYNVAGVYKSGYPGCWHGRCHIRKRRH